MSRVLFLTLKSFLYGAFVSSKALDWKYTVSKAASIAVPKTSVKFARTMTAMCVPLSPSGYTPAVFLA